jgi:hypothetical protein
MAAQILNSVTVNYDDPSISGLLNGENITLNNSTLNIDSDSRWGQQAAVLGSLIISAASGGKINVNAENTLWIAFDASTGNVPTLGTVGTNDVSGSIAGAGEFLGIWTALGTDPLASGAAMPVSGFIKLRRATTSFIDNEVMTFSNGATVTINGTPKQGWIHIVGAEAATINVPRLGEFNSRGGWFEIGTTNGSDDQTFQYPVLDYCPAIQIETAPGSGVYEWWLAAGDRWGTATQYVATDLRGKYFGCVPSTGVITIARRASSPCGFKPVSGLRVRIPNIILSSSTSANWNLNTINNTAGSRYDFTTANSGYIDMRNTIGNWNINFGNPYFVNLANNGFLVTSTVTNTASTTTIDNCATGLYLAQDFNAFSFSNLFSGLVVTNCRVARYASTASAQSAISVSDCTNVLFENVITETFGTATTIERGIATTYSIAFSRVSGITLNNCGAICGALALTTSSDVTISNYRYADKMNGTTSTTVGANSIFIQSFSNNISIDGWGFLFPSIANLHPYLGFLSATSSNQIYVKNIGSPSSPIDGGSTNQMGAIVSGSVVKTLEMRRCYFENMRLIPLSLANTVQDVVLDNIWTDGADTSVNPSLNVLTRGCRWTPSQTAQTACYGRHWEDSFLSTTIGNILILGNEPLAATASQAVSTAGNPLFNSAGGVQLPFVGDQITWEMPYSAIGHTKLSGGNRIGVIGTLVGNMSYEYQINTGSGYSAWKFLFTTRLRASGGTAGTNTFVYTSVGAGREPQIGDYAGSVNGNLPEGTTVTNVVGNTVTFSNNFTVSLNAGQGVVFWTDLESEPSFDPNIGVRLKVRATTLVENLTNQISFIQIPTTTDSVSQQLQYPLPVVQNTAQVNGIEDGSRIRVYNITTNTEIANEIVSGTSWTLLYGEGTSFTNGDVVEIRLAKVVGTIAYLPQTLVSVATASGFTALASQELDAVYNTNAIDGSLVTELSGDYPNIQIDSNDADGETTVQRIYAWFAYNQSTELGIENFYEAIFAEDLVNYRIRATVVNLKIDNIISTPLMVIGGRIYRDDGETVIAASSNSIQLDPSKAYAIEVGTSGLTPTEAATLNKINTLTEDVSGLRFTAKALEEAPAGGGGGSLTAADVWTYSTRELTTAFPSVPTATQNATAVRSELSTELGRIDASVSSRLATSGYTAPANSDIAAIKAKTDTLVNTDLTGIATSAEIAALNDISSAEVRAQVDAGLATYDGPTKAELDSAIASIPSAPSASVVASQVRTELNTELSRIDATVSSRNSVAPDNANIALIKAKVDTLENTDLSEVKKNTDLIPAAL